MHERFVSVTFEKSFGQFGLFIGVVKEVWRHDSGSFFAHVVYNDGDREDISVQDLEELMSKERKHSREMLIEEADLD